MKGRRGDQRKAGEKGQALVLFALFLIVLLGAGALLVDGGLGWTSRREAQTAADTAALAAVKARAAGTSITTAANDMAAANGYPAGTVTCNGQTRQGVVVNSPPAGSWTPPVGMDPVTSNYIEVIVTRSMRTALAGAVGQPCWLVSARAVARVIAEVTTSGAPYPAMLGSSSCDSGAITVEGNGLIVNGDVISNSGIADPGNGTVVNGTMSFVPNPTGCGPFSAPVPFASDSYTVTARTTLVSYPLMYSLDTTTSPWTVRNLTTGASAPCNFQPTTGTNITITQAIPTPGIYCATGNVILNANNMIANFTLVAGGRIDHLGSGAHTLTAYWDNLLAFALHDAPASSPAIHFRNATTFTGLIFAPNGTPVVTGNAGSVSRGAVWGKTVVIRGNQSWTLDASGLGTFGTTTTTYRPGTLVE